MAASGFSAIRRFRDALLDLQRSFPAASAGLVADGRRDMGAVMFPNRTVKIYLTASANASRRTAVQTIDFKGNTIAISPFNRFGGAQVLICPHEPRRFKNLLSKHAVWHPT
jgi:cytidylate kinase